MSNKAPVSAVNQGKIPKNPKEFIERIMSKDAFTHVLAGVLVDMNYKVPASFIMIQSIADNSISYAFKSFPRIIISMILEKTGIDITTGIKYIDEGAFNVLAGVLYKYLLSVLEPIVINKLPAVLIQIYTNIRVPYTDMGTEIISEIMKEFGSQLANITLDMILDILPKQV
jgi:hypothetical protein